MKNKFLGILIGLLIIGVIFISGCVNQTLDITDTNDSEEENECYKEGETIGTMPLPRDVDIEQPECCEGLVEIPVYDESGLYATDIAYCTNCGDNICKSPENKYSCEVDCS